MSIKLLKEIGKRYFYSLNMDTNLLRDVGYRIKRYFWANYRLKPILHKSTPYKAEQVRGLNEFQEEYLFLFEERLTYLRSKTYRQNTWQWAFNYWSVASSFIQTRSFGYLAWLYRYIALWSYDHTESCGYKSSGRKKTNYFCKPTSSRILIREDLELNMLKLYSITFLKKSTESAKNSALECAESRADQWTLQEFRSCSLSIYVR